MRGIILFEMRGDDIPAKVRRYVRKKVSMSREDNLRRDISWFLATNKTIDRINFAVKGKYKVYPSAFKSDVSYAIKGERIRTTLGTVPRGGVAMYSNGGLLGDKIVLSPLFALNDYRSQTVLIHECVHAHLDIQNIGRHSLYENEAVAYIAGGVYLEALKRKPSTKERFVWLAQAIAEKVLKGTYWVPDQDSDPLIKAIARHPAYAGYPTTESNGAWSYKHWFNPCK